MFKTFVSLLSGHASYNIIMKRLGANIFEVENNKDFRFN
jgi:hypothetical protein